MQLSPGYTGAARQARQRGWRVDTLDADHLAVLTRAPEIADVITS